MPLKAPFPWFGGKSLVAGIVWERFGSVKNYVEPFAGSLAVLLGAPDGKRIETVNDIDGYIANFWRAVASDPDAVAHYADWPVSECDLHARHAYLTEVKPEFTSRLEGDPDFCDTKIAGWWVWGICCWIGGGFTSGKGPWHRVDGRLVKNGSGDRGTMRQRPHLSHGGQGIHGQDPTIAWMRDLSARLRRVRVCCGDWSRVLGTAPTTGQGLTGAFLDPPYGDVRDKRLYACDSLTVTDDVGLWCSEHGDDPLLRIAMCGYEGERNALERQGWVSVPWRTAGGYAAPTDRERIWFSPACLGGAQGSLFG